MKFLKRKKIYISIFVVLLFGIVFYFIYVNNDNEVTAIEEVEEDIIEKEEVEAVINKIKVDIKGMVNNPGVYELDEGSRVIDVINVSGGLIEGSDTSNINLSKKLKDENVIIIGSMKEPEKVIEYVYKECECPKINNACINNSDVVNYQESVVSNIDNSNESTSNSLISINSANLEALMTLPSIGESKAKSIISYREENGEFSKIEDIMNVSGIGNALFEKIKDYISL